jgi:hypothetical protein
VSGYPPLSLFLKVVADGVAKIRVPQNYRKLNDAIKKDFYHLPFTDIILDHAAGHTTRSTSKRKIKFTPHSPQTREHLLLRECHLVYVML